jgi:hypothetical protein
VAASVLKAEQTQEDAIRYGRKVGVCSKFPPPLGFFLVWLAADEVYNKKEDFANLNMLVCG